MRSPAEAGRVPRRPRRKLRASLPAVHDLAAADGEALRLTRYRGGPRGPVLLVHCIGVSSRMYSTDTIETNLLEYLFEHGFDVWLIDYRLSIELPGADRPSSFDQVAALDFPAAVERVLAESGASSLQVVAHGVGSQTFTMAMLRGLRGVRSAVCSQVSTHLRAPWLNRFKAGLPLPELLETLSMDTLSVVLGSDADWRDRMLALGMELHPVDSEERCDNRVCRRITAMYGPLYEHDRLSAATHDALGELFGQTNLRAFGHLIRNLRKGHIVDERGEEAYLPHLDRLAIPIAYLHGAENACLLPESTRLTREALCRANGADLYARHLIPGYGHVDCILGEHADRDVYPLVVDHLLATDA